MRFGIEHSFAVSRARFEALIEDAAHQARLLRELPGIAAAELLSEEERHGVLHRRVRFTPAAALRGDGIPSYGRGLIKPEMLIWVEDSRFVRAAHRIDYTVEPNLPPKWRDRFTSQGSFHFLEAGAHVLRRVEGELRVHVAVLGRLAEAFLVGELKQGLAREAAALRRLLGE